MPWGFRFITNMNQWRLGAEPVYTLPSHPTQIYEASIYFIIFLLGLYLFYFYITGMDIAFRHLVKVLVAGLYTGALGMALLPLLRYLLLRAPGSGLMARRRRKRQMARAAKPLERAGKEALAAAAKGGTKI